MSRFQTNAPKGVERKQDASGQPNKRYVDLLDEDRPIAGQAYFCASFISPEDIVKQREAYFFEQFVKTWEFAKSVEKFTQFLNFLAAKYSGLDVAELMKDFEEFVKEEAVDIKTGQTLEGDYRTFLEHKEADLMLQFNKDHEFQTSVRGFKFRGAFPSIEEAELHCKIQREADPTFDISVGPVGMWIPFDPAADKTARVEYMEEELNQLMHEKKKNEVKAKTEFEFRVKEAKRKAIEENVAKAKLSGNLLTQTIDADGQLVGMSKGNTQEIALTNGPATVDDIRAQLFDGDNVVITKGGDHGEQNLLNKLAKSAELV